MQVHNPPAKRFAHNVEVDTYPTGEEYAKHFEQFLESYSSEDTGAVGLDDLPEPSPETTIQTPAENHFLALTPWDDPWET